MILGEKHSLPTTKDEVCYSFQCFLFVCLTWSLNLLPRLECSGAILTDYSLYLLGSRNPPASASQAGTIGMHHHSCIFSRDGFYHVGQAGPELLTSGDSPASVSQSAGITGLSHCAWPQFSVFYRNLITFIWLLGFPPQVC